MALCIMAAGKTAVLALNAFTLVWTHSVERTEWREDWVVTGERLMIERASVEGTGAGMEIPDGAVLENGAWVYEPALPPIAVARFADAGQGSDWRICVGGSTGERCRPLGQLVPTAGADVTIAVCDRPPTRTFDD